jgi:hypothetical protein
MDCSFWSLQISNIVNFPSGTRTIAQSQALSISQTFTAGLSSDLIKPITAGVSYSWTESVSSTTTYTLPLAGCKPGYLAFYPFMNFVSGTCWMSGCDKPDSPHTECIGYLLK